MMQNPVPFTDTPPCPEKILTLTYDRRSQDEEEDGHIINGTVRRKTSFPWPASFTAWSAAHGLSAKG